MNDSPVRLFLALACVAVLALVSGCSSEPEDGREPEPVVNATTTATQNATVAAQDASAVAQNATAAANATADGSPSGAMPDMVWGRGAFAQGERDTSCPVSPTQGPAPEYVTPEGPGPDIPAAAPAAPAEVAQEPSVQAAPAAPKRMAAAQPPRAKPRAPKRAAPARPVTIETASAQFDDFARNWVRKIGRNLRHTATDMDVAREPKGVVVRFAEVQHEGLDIEVKPSASGGRACPYIGVLRYLEHHYENVAPNESEARKGPFTRVKTMRVTEIFRYVSGRWMN